MFSSAPFIERLLSCDPARGLREICCVVTRHITQVLWRVTWQHETWGCVTLCDGVTLSVTCDITSLLTIITSHNRKAGRGTQLDNLLVFKASHIENEKYDMWIEWCKLIQNFFIRLVASITKLLPEDPGLNSEWFIIIGWEHDRNTTWIISSESLFFFEENYDFLE